MKLICKEAKCSHKEYRQMYRTEILMAWMARKAGGAIQRLYRQSTPKTHLPHSLLSGLLAAKDTQHVTCLHHASVLHPILHPPGIPKVPLHR